jgi:menaquinone-dependent protoporphyrinogen IX oxidase
METKVLVAFPSGESAARAVAETIAEGLADVAITADVAADGSVTDLAQYGALVLGTPRDRDSELHPPKLVWIEPAQQQALPVAVYGLESRALAEEERAAARTHLEHALLHMPWLYPLAVEVFSTALEEERPGGDAPVAALDLVDREAVRRWTHMLPGLLHLPVPVD